MFKSDDVFDRFDVIRYEFDFCFFTQGRLQSGLAAKVGMANGSSGKHGGAAAGDEPPARFPEMLQAVLQGALEGSNASRPSLTSFCSHPHASTFLQSLLLAVKNDT